MEEKQLTTMEEIDALIEEQNNYIELGMSLKRLRNNPDFKKVIESAFIEDGKEILWKNIKSYEEAELLTKGSTRVENIDLMKGELGARLKTERFLDSIKAEAESAEEALLQLSEEKTKLQEEGE